MNTSTRVLVNTLALVASIVAAPIGAAGAPPATSYTHDADGNLTSKTEDGLVWTYLYDARNLLTEVNRDGVLLESYQYDYQGRRIKKTGPDGVVRYVWDDDTILLETDDHGNTITKYEHAADRALAVHHTAHERAYYLFDALGSPVGLSKPDGSLAVRYSYNAWGGLRSQAGSFANSFLFTGHELDSATGLYSAGARYYDPEVGRFLTEDPFSGDITNPPSLHRYIYAFASPAVYTDPTGECALITDGPCSALADDLERTLEERVAHTGFESFDTASRRVGQLLISPLTGLLRLGQGSGEAVSLLAESATEFSPMSQREMLDSGEFQGTLLGAALDIAAVGPVVSVAGNTLRTGAALARSLAAPAIGTHTRLGSGIVVEAADGGVALQALRTTHPAPPAAETLAFRANGSRETASDVAERVLSNIAISAGARDASAFGPHTARTAQALIHGYSPDEWATTTLRRGDLVYGGLPGASPFYTDFATVRASKLHAPALAQATQVRPHVDLGYRPLLGAYRVVGGTRVPEAKALANIAYGPGHGRQFFIHDYMQSLQLVRTFTLFP